jgi:DNA-binding transcriptional LysR family regulator
METNRVRQFCAVYETQNLRKASELLGISHGGLSKSLKVLEGELGFALFHAIGRGLGPTDAARAFYPGAKEFLRQEERLLRPRTEAAPELRIASFEVFTTYFLPRLIAEGFAGYRLLVHELIPGLLEDAVAEGRVDVAITYDPTTRPGVEFLRAGKVSMGIFGAPALARGARDALALPFVAPVFPVHGTPSDVKGLDGFPDHRHPRRVVYQVELLQTALQLAGQGVAVGFFPRFLVRLYNETVREDLRLVEVRSAIEVARPIYIVKRQSTPESKEIKRLAARLRGLR